VRIVRPRHGQRTGADLDCTVRYRVAGRRRYRPPQEL